MVPKTDWFYTLGSAAMILALLQGITGMLLTIYYVPTPDHAYDSIQYIMNDVMFGWLIRGMHHWGATLLVIVVFLHMLKSYFVGAYKYPREITWLTGGVLLLVVLVMGFSGYLLPWNQKAYWATSVGTAIAGAVPVIGPLLERILPRRPGDRRGDAGALLRAAHLVDADYCVGDDRRASLSGDPHRHYVAAGARRVRHGCVNGSWST